MRTTRIMLALAVVALLALPAIAQEKAEKKRKAPQISATGRLMLRMGKLREALKAVDLTAEQKEKLEAVRKEVGPKMGEAFGKMREILTEEQAKAVEEAAKKAREAGKKDRALVQAVEAAIKLTDEQQKKLDKVAQEMTATHRAMMKKVMGILTAEQKEKVRKQMMPQRAKAAKPAEKKKA